MLVLKTNRDSNRDKSRRFQTEVNKTKYPLELYGMKELLQQFAAYNIWANQKIMDVILALPDEKQMAEVPSSFNSLYKTVLHMWDAESIWWQRMKLHERIIVPSENLNSNMKDVVNGLMQQSMQWLDWVSSASDIALDHVFQYQNTKKEQFKQPIYQMVLHLFNHGTYHRGQLINMLRQLGVEKLPPTDFIIWSRSKR
jgi:uncharacterized damage-inducible protein DinB